MTFQELQSRSIWLWPDWQRDNWQTQLGELLLDNVVNYRNAGKVIFVRWNAVEPTFLCDGIRNRRRVRHTRVFRSLRQLAPSLVVDIEPKHIWARFTRTDEAKLRLCCAP